MVRNYKPRTDRATYDGALVTRTLEELDKGKSLRRCIKRPTYTKDNANSTPKSKRKLQQQNQGTRFPA